jgi:hypothetical protein
MKFNDWAGLAAVILSLAIASFVIILGYGITHSKMGLSSQEEALIASLMGAVVGAVATYLGVRGGSRIKDENNVNNEEEPPQAS